jgi:hypothetical protein
MIGNIILAVFLFIVLIILMNVAFYLIFKK